VHRVFANLFAKLAGRYARGQGTKSDKAKYKNILSLHAKPAKHKKKAFRGQ
jgi:hypothetical protein